MNEQLIKQYAELDARMRALDVEKEIIRKQILDELKTRGLDKFSDPTYGSFTITHRSSWTYSDAITKKEEALKIAKFKEQEKGIAEKVVSEGLLYKPVKADE